MSSTTNFGTINEAKFKTFFEKELRPELDQLESERQIIQKRNVRLVAVIAPLIVAGFITLLALESIILTFVAFGLAGTVYLLFYKEPDQWNALYKANVISPMLKFCHPSLTLDYQKGITEEDYAKTQLFKKRTDKYTAEDLICGQIEDITFSYSEVHSEENVSNSGTYTIFKGIIFKSDFNKKFEGHYILKKDLADTGKLGKMASKLHQFERIQLESPEFEKLFDLRGTDQVEGRYIFSTAFMERVVQLQKELDTDIELAFVDEQMYVSIKNNDGRDEYDHAMALKANHYMHLFKSYKLTCQILSIIDILDLTNDIWKTK